MQSPQKRGQLTQLNFLVLFYVNMKLEINLFYLQGEANEKIQEKRHN